MGFDSLWLILFTFLENGCFFLRGDFSLHIHFFVVLLNYFFAFPRKIGASRGCFSNG